MKNLTMIAVIAAVATSAAVPSLAKDRGGKGGRMINFETLDTNKDGFITAEEIAANRKARFDASDANNDGFLTQDEVKAAFDKRMADAGKEVKADRAEKRLGRMFRAMDENSDGKIALAEMPDRSERMIERLDTDKDGKISKAELEAKKGKRKGKRG